MLHYGLTDSQSAILRRQNEVYEAAFKRLKWRMKGPGIVRYVHRLLLLCRLSQRNRHVMTH